MEIIKNSSSLAPIADKSASQLFLSRNNEQLISPAAAYLLSLQSDKSKVTMESTLNLVAGILKCSSWKDVSWNDLKRDHVHAIMATLAKQGLAPSTRNRYLAAIKGVMREAWRSGAISGDTYHRIQDVSSVKGTRLGRKGRVIPKADIYRLLDRSSENSDTILNVRNRAIVALMLTSGLRKSEICQLKTDDVNLDSREMVIVGKGDKEALLPMQPTAIPHIQYWLELKGCYTEFMFNPLTRSGRAKDKALTDSGVSHVLREAADMAGVDRFAPHDTRRTYATSLFSAGLDAHKVRELMRHSRLETTQLYNIRDQRELKDALASVNIIG